MEAFKQIKNYVSRERSRVVEVPDRDRHGLGSKSTRAILLCPLYSTFPYLVVLVSGSKLKSLSQLKSQTDSNILTSSEAG